MPDVDLSTYLAQIQDGLPNASAPVRQALTALQNGVNALNAVIPQPVTSLPAPPINDGAEIFLQPTAFTAAPFAGDDEIAPWHLRYRAGSAGVSKWDVLDGGPLIQTVQFDESTTSTAYTDLDTVGPSVTVPVTGVYDVHFEAAVTAGMVGGGNGTALVAPKFGAAIPNGNNAAFVTIGSTSTSNMTSQVSVSRTIPRVRLTAGTVVKLQYAIGGGGVPLDFSCRLLALTPVRIG